MCLATADRKPTNNNKCGFGTCHRVETFCYCYAHTSPEWIRNSEVYHSRKRISAYSVQRDDTIFRNELEHLVVSSFIHSPHREQWEFRNVQYDEYSDNVWILKQKKSQIGEIGLLQSRRNEYNLSNIIIIIVTIRYHPISRFHWYHFIIIIRYISSILFSLVITLRSVKCDVFHSLLSLS